MRSLDRESVLQGTLSDSANSIFVRDLRVVRINWHANGHTCLRTLDCMFVENYRGDTPARVACQPWLGPIRSRSLARQLRSPESINMNFELASVLSVREIAGCGGGGGGGVNYEHLDSLTPDHESFIKILIRQFE